MEGGRWKVESGKWKMERGKWKGEEGKGKRVRVHPPTSILHPPFSNFHPPFSILRHIRLRRGNRTSSKPRPIKKPAITASMMNNPGGMIQYQAPRDIA